MHIQSKLPQVGTSIFSVIAECLSRYPKTINLAQGAPNFMLAPEMIDEVEKAMREGKNQYAPMIGVESLREAMAQKVKNLYGYAYDPQDEITIMPSASEAIYASIAALVHAGDEVIYFEPSFDSYAPIVELHGAKPVPIELHAPDFSIDWHQVKDALNPRTRMIIINSPHNPTGRILTKDDILALSELVRDTNVIILSDEVYEHMVFDGDAHRSMSAYPELAERSIVVTSFGKTYQVTGWRVGCCVAPAVLMEQIRLVHQFLMFSANTPIQYALAKILEKPSCYTALSAIFQEKRDILRQGLRQTPLEVLPCQGGFFQLIRFDHLSALSDQQILQFLIEKIGIGGIPMGAFYRQAKETGLIRLSFARDNDTLHQAVKCLANNNAFLSISTR